MNVFTTQELDAIEDNPLGDSLDLVREALCNAESPLDDLQLDGTTDVVEDADSPRRPRLFVAALAKLLSILIGSEVTVLLASRFGRDSLLSDLAAVIILLRTNDITYYHQYFRPLSRAVIKQAQDVEIWTAVINLVLATSHSTPPPSTPPSVDTPITHSSASQQGPEQTRQLIEERVFEEIRHCTHRAVGGFHEKYFQGRKWNRRANQIWQRAKKHYSDHRWTQLPSKGTEEELCKWWLNLQKELLANERTAFFRSSGDNRVGAEAQRQLDLFVKLKRDGLKHDWRDALIGSAVRNVFAAQPTRRFIHAFSLRGTRMENWVYDRAGPYSGATFDIHEEPDKFIQVMCGYLMMSDEEFRLDTFIAVKDYRLFVTIPVEPRIMKRKRKLELDAKPIAFQRAIVCRGTTCFRARDVGSTELDIVVKLSWTSNKRLPEADLLRKAHERGVKGIAKLVGYCEEVTSISKLRQGLVFGTPYKFRDVPGDTGASISQSRPRSHSIQFPNLSVSSDASKKRKSIAEISRASKRSQSHSSLHKVTDQKSKSGYSIKEPQGNSLIQQDQDLPYDGRIFRVLAISPAGRCISQFRSVLELLEALCDTIKVHRSLSLDGKILHRDISENNIIITDPKKADGFKGMLIDLDLANEEGRGPSGARHRTGTMEFMAIEVLLGISHTYRHDLEAFFYVLLWLCARRGWALSEAPHLQPRQTRLTLWYTGSYQAIARVKSGDMLEFGLEFILNEFPEEFNCVKPLCKRIRNILFSHKGSYFTGTPKDPNVLYDPIIAAFDDAIAGILLQDANTS
ncbi:serine/threonine-protein kinase Sgk2 [Trichoderma compactum]